jgi:hypothetical protein
MKAERLRQRAKQRLQETEALAILTHQLNAQNATQIAQTRREIDAASSKRLSEIVIFAERHIGALKVKSGFRGEFSYIFTLVKKARSQPSRIFTIPKWHIDPLWEVQSLLPGMGHLPSARRHPN